MPVEESPPPYSSVVTTPETLEFLGTGLPFSHSDQLATEIRALISEGSSLCSRFKDFHEVASAGVKFEYQVPALILSQNFETLIWESRNIAGIALVAVKDFNEVILDFLSEPSATVQDRIKELTNATNLLKRERDSAAGHKSSFDVHIQELEDYSRMVHSESGVLNLKRRRQCLPNVRRLRGARPSWKSNSPSILPRSEQLSGLSMISTSLGAISRTCMDYALRFEHIAEQAVFPSYVSSPPDSPAMVRELATQNHSPDADPADRKRLCLPSPTRYAELTSFPVLVDALLRDVRTFVSRTNVFDTVLVDLAREQDVFVVYLKDGQSISNQGYRSEIIRLRRHLPSICSALDAYSKAKLT